MARKFKAPAADNYQGLRDSGWTNTGAGELYSTKPPRQPSPAASCGVPLSGRLRSRFTVPATFRVEPCGIRWSEGKQHGVVYRPYKALRVHGRGALTFFGSGSRLPGYRIKVQMLNTYVYFIAELSNVRLVHRIKVGVATKPKKRLAVLQTGNSRELELLFTIGPMGRQQAYDIEGQLHRSFSRYHLRGEWFKKHALREIGEFQCLPWSGSVEVHSDHFQLNWRYGSEPRRPKTRICEK